MQKFKRFKRFKRRSDRKRIKRKMMKLSRPIRFEPKVLAKKFRFTHLMLNDNTTPGFSLYEYQTLDPTNPCWRFDAGGGYSITQVNDYLATNVATPQPSEYADYANLYDLMRVVGVKLEYTPGATVSLTSSAYLNSFLWTWYDIDNVRTVTPNVTGARLSSAVLAGSSPYFQDYTTLRKHQLTKAFKRYFKIPKRLSGAPSTLAYNSLATSTSDGFYNTAAPYLNGMIYLFQKDMIGTGATGAAVNTVIGEVTATYYVLFKYRV